jgi:hypothetical protein
MVLIGALIAAFIVIALIHVFEGSVGLSGILQALVVGVAVGFAVWHAPKRL